MEGASSGADPCLPEAGARTTFKTGDCPIPGVNAGFSLASNGAKHKLHITMARASFPSHIPRFDNGIAVT
jgi:hypothetical protein